MQFSRLVRAFERLEETASSREMTAILADLLRGAEPDELDTLCYITLGEIAAGYREITLGIGVRTASAAIARAFDLPRETVDAAVRSAGDAGDAAAALGGAETRIFPEVFTFGEHLTVGDVHRGLLRIAVAAGPGSEDVRQKILAAMIAGAAAAERRYILRLATGTMRLGVGDMTLLDALATAFLGSKKRRPLLEHAYNLCSDIGYVATTLAAGGPEGVERIGVTLFRPVRPMLTQRVSRFDEIFEKIGSAVVAAEEKYDGERIQAHKDGDAIRLFSRRLTDVTGQFPDIVDLVRTHIAADSCILDGEAVAYDPEAGSYHPFQRLMRRRRKYRVAEFAERIPATYRVFDVLLTDGAPHLSAPYPERRRILERVIRPGTFIAASDRVVTPDPAVVADFFAACIDRGLEGVVCKSTSPESSYRAGGREWQWIKWKKSYGSDLADTLDLVVVGANAGRGKRAGTYGSLLCAAYNHEEDLFQTVCKLGTGFTDEELRALPEMLGKARAGSMPARVMATDQARPDVWFVPRYVLEVLGSEITESPVHTCAWDAGRQRGLALRFPRFVRWRREKDPEQATTAAEVAAMHRRQGKAR